MSGENQNESKFMAMLERRGIVRKVSLDDDSPALAHVGDTARTEAEMLAENEARANSASRQNESEFDSLVRQADESIAASQAQREQYEPTVSTQTSVMPAEQHQPAPSYEAPVAQSAPVADYSRGYTAQAHPAESQTQGSAYGETTAYQQDTEETPSRENMFSWMGGEEAPEPVPAPLPVDDSIERYLDVEELYEVLSLRSKKTDTIYLIEDYLKSIPDSLPDESRRQIVSKIIAASGFDYDLLMGDGILRVKMLKEYAERFARHTDDYVEARMAEISQLEGELERIQNLIDKRRELHKKQFLSIEAEAGRLREILTFING